MTTQQLTNKTEKQHTKFDITLVEHKTIQTDHSANITNNSRPPSFQPFKSPCPKALENNHVFKNCLTITRVRHACKGWRSCQKAVTITQKAHFPDLLIDRSASSLLDHIAWAETTGVRQTIKQQALCHALNNQYLNCTEAKWHPVYLAK